MKFKGIKLATLLFFAVFLLFFSNDFGLIDVEKTAIITAVAIDLEDDGNYKVTAQIAVPEATDTNSENKRVQISGTGSTIGGAIKNIGDTSGWFPQLAFCNLIVVGGEFKDYNERLLFESYNEMLDKYNSWCFATFNSPSRYNAEEAADAYEAINSFAQSFVNVVRSSGGNNTQRNLIVNTYGACNGSGTWNPHLQDPLKEMKMPEGESNHIAFEVHNYPSISNLSDAKEKLDQNIKDLQSTLGALGAPVIYGEWGTSSANGDGTSDYDNNRENMIEFMKYYIQQTKAAGIGTFYWMGIADGACRDYPYFSQPDLAEAITKAWHGDDFEGKYPTKQDVIGTSTIIYNVEYSGDWQELNLCGSAVSMNNYKSIRLEMYEFPASMSLQFKVYGSDDNHIQSAAISATELTSTLDFNESTLGGKTIKRVTLQTLSGAGACKVKRAVLIKNDGTEVETELSVFWGCSMSTEVITSITPILCNNSQDPRIYTLSGQRITTPRKGIYIRNGKKIVL